MEQITLSPQDLYFVVNGYIGVNAGYLGDFSYRTHAEFYPTFCGLDIDPSNYEGTTRERFIAILKEIAVADQVKVLQGVVARFSDSREADKTARMNKIIQLLQSQSPISAPVIKNASIAVKQALSDAEVLIQTNGAANAVDRIHTALHGYLQSFCTAAQLSTSSKDPSITELLKTLQKSPALQNAGVHSDAVRRILNSFGTILDTINQLRNHASLAHPNDVLLQQAEAELVVDSVNTLLRYLERILPNIGELDI